jgi:hypothetical protein
MTRLAFMSQEHVDEMNALIAGSLQVRKAATELGTDRVLAFELADGPDGDTVWWLLDVGPSGFQFRLGEPTTQPDVVIRADFTAMIRAVRAEREGRQEEYPQEVVGDPELMARIFEVLEVARPIATLDTELPKV